MGCGSSSVAPKTAKEKKSMYTTVSSVDKLNQLVELRRSVRGYPIRKNKEEEVVIEEGNGEESDDDDEDDEDDEDLEEIEEFERKKFRKKRSRGEKPVNSVHKSPRPKENEMVSVVKKKSMYESLSPEIKLAQLVSRRKRVGEMEELTAGNDINNRDRTTAAEDIMEKEDSSDEDPDDDEAKEILQHKREKFRKKLDKSSFRPAIRKSILTATE